MAKGSKLKKKPARQDKRARNRARNEKGLPTARGARPTRLSAVEKVLLGGGMLRSFNPYRGRD